MDKAAYKAAWQAVHQFDAEALERAAAFFDQAPTGQYDEEAAACIRAVLAQRKADAIALGW